MNLYTLQLGSTNTSVFTYNTGTVLHKIYKQSLRKEATINQVTIIPTTSKNVQFSGHNHLLTTGTIQ